MQEVSVHKSASNAEQGSIRGGRWYGAAQIVVLCDAPVVRRQQ